MAAPGAGHRKAVRKAAAKRPPANPYLKFNDSIGSVGAPGSYAKNRVAENQIHGLDVKGPLLGTPGVSRSTAKPPSAEDIAKLQAAIEANQPDPMKDLFAQLMSGIHSDVGAGPNLQDYIGQFAPARQQAIGYRDAATGKINEGTQQLLQKLQATGAQGQQDNAAAAAAAKGQTQQVNDQQNVAALKAAADLKAQGVSSAPVEQTQQAIGGQLAAQTANQDAFAAKLAQIQTSEGADRQASANTMGQGAIGVLGQHTNDTLNQLNVAEAQARRQYGQDSAQHAAAASNAKSNDVQQRLQLAQQFADLDNSTQVDPTAQLRKTYHGVGEVQDAFDSLDNGDISPAQLRIQIQASLADASSPKDGAAKNHDKIARLKAVDKAIGEWEKATHPDAKKAAKQQQMATLAKYLQPHA